MNISFNHLLFQSYFRQLYKKETEKILVSLLYVIQERALDLSRALRAGNRTWRAKKASIPYLTVPVCKKLIPIWNQFVHPVPIWRLSSQPDFSLVGASVGTQPSNPAVEICCFSVLPHSYSRHWKENETMMSPIGIIDAGYDMYSCCAAQPPCRLGMEVCAFFAITLCPAVNKWKTQRIPAGP